MKLAAISGVNGAYTDEDISRIRDLALNLNEIIVIIRIQHILLNAYQGFKSISNSPLKLQALLVQFIPNA